MSRPIVHIEFQVSDPKKSMKWYSEVFGWETSYMDEMSYGMFSTGEGQLGGGFNPNAETNLTGTVVYVDTQDIPGTLAKAEAAGGKVIVPESEIPGMGWFALMSDPDGNVVGVFKGTQG
jgi:predicted enzyme related to lactoylglutathione lyase